MTFVLKINESEKGHSSCWHAIGLLKVVFPSKRKNIWTKTKTKTETE